MTVHRSTLAVATCAGLAWTSSLHAQTWQELGDAGDLPASAQRAAGSGPLTMISGSMEAASDVDMYQILVHDFQAFSASTVGLATFDTQLFLFNAGGLGIAANDDEVGGATLQSRITSQFIPGNGIYYLAISLYNRDPLSSSGQIFSPPVPRSEVNANGPGAQWPVDSWTGSTSATGVYSISLTGASLVNLAATGACCMTHGACTSSSLQQCLNIGGNFAGENTTCATANCPPGGSCCLSNGTCSVLTSAVCLSLNGFWGGPGSGCSPACVAVSYAALPLTYNWNGMVTELQEQGPANFNNPQGYRSIADRGLLLSGVGNSINAGPLTGLGGMPYTLNTAVHTLDIVHLGDRRFVANGARNWGTSANNALQPSWLLENDQTTPQVSSVLGIDATLSEQSRIGIIYQISDFGGSFDCILTFTDNTSATLTFRAPDWFNSQTPPAVTSGSGLIAQRQLGTYASTQDTDNATTSVNNLNVVEAVTSVQQLMMDGYGNFAGKRLASVTFLNPVSNANYPNSTPGTGSGVAILAATLSYPATVSCYANCDGSTAAPILNVADFGCFLQKFAAGDPYANCDGSTQAPMLNVADFGCFLQRFAAGCP